MGMPLVMMRNREGEIQVFHNVCSHRGMILVQEEGTIEGVIRCQYHSWSYDLNGNLKVLHMLAELTNIKMNDLNVKNMV